MCSVDHTLTLVVTPCILGGVGGIGAGSPGCIWPVSPRTRKFRSVACVHALVSLSLVLVSCPARWVPMVLPPTRLDMLVMGRAPRLAILLEGTARHTLLLPCIRRDMEVLLPMATRAVTRCTQRPRLRQGLVGCSVQLFPSHVQKSLRRAVMCSFLSQVDTAVMVATLPQCLREDPWVLLELVMRLAWQAPATRCPGVPGTSVLRRKLVTVRRSSSTDTPFPSAMCSRCESFIFQCERCYIRSADH